MPRRTGLEVRAGEMRERIRVEEQVSSRDAAGAPTLAWNTVVECRCAMEPLVGREYFASAQRNAKQRWKVRLRRHDAIETVKPRMRIIWRGRVLDIVSCAPFLDLRRELVIVADELVEEPE